ncbi:MAG: type II toxin-antitoxin system HicB family antitoxin [Lautropia sp.]|nr:type II toxin-antitoxin system HicB family antitoxin [Lautropia sp.]
MAQYALVIEKRGSNFRAYVPDLPGCTASGRSATEAEQALRELVRVTPHDAAGHRLHERAMRAAGYTLVSPVA